MIFRQRGIKGFRRLVLTLDLVWLLCVMCGYAKDRADCKRKNVAVHAFYGLLSFAHSGLWIPAFAGMTRKMDSCLRRNDKWKIAWGNQHYPTSHPPRRLGGCHPSELCVALSGRKKNARATGPGYRRIPRFYIGG